MKCLLLIILFGMTSCVVSSHRETEYPTYKYNPIKKVYEENGKHAMISEILKRNK